ncbi:hypothetical protein EDB85DRAFT_2291580, partial [Lactarius pseudohatsudake]
MNPPGPLVLRLAPAHALLDRSVAAPSWVVCIKHEKYGSEPVDVELLRLLLRLSEACSDAADGTSSWRRKRHERVLHTTPELEILYLGIEFTICNSINLKIFICKRYHQETPYVRPRARSKDDAGVTHESNKFKDSILIRWNLDMIHTSAAL